MADETYNGYANRETWAFNLHWSNDQGLYNETLTYAKDYIDGRTVGDPDAEVSDRELGEVVVTYWSEYMDGLENDGYELGGTMQMFRNEVGSWWRIDHAEVGAAVRESLDAES